MHASWTSRANALYPAVGMTLAAVYFAFPKGGNAQAVIYEGLGGTASLAILWAVRLHRPAQPLPWILFALGNTCFVVGDVIAIFRLNPPVPSTTDVFYLAGYPLFAWGLLILMFSAGGRNRIAAVADVGIVTFAFAIVQWVAVMGPAIQSAGGHLSARIVFGLYPAMDIVLLAGLVGFFVSSAWRTTSFRYLLAATTMLVIGDEIAGLTSGYTAGDAIDVTWMLSYVFLGAAALHPSMRRLSQPRRLPVLRVSAWRVSLLAGALLMGPGVLLVQKLRGEPLDVYEVVALECVIALLVVARLTGILRSLERIRIRERTARTLAEEAHRQLALKNEELVEADKLKDEFVALISHDLRTPLTSIVGYVELVLDEDVDPPLDDERRTYLKVVARSSERLLRLVDDLLFVARLQAGRLVLDTVPLDLAEATAQAVDEARPHAELKGLAITFLGDTAVPVEADRGRIFQLLANLISNAIKFTPEGGRVDVRVLRTADGAVLEVTDTGIGLAPGEPEQVFERFFRSERATDRQIPGTGLGLFIARAITEAHGGTISASSPRGEGTTFRIELPARVPPTPEANAEELMA